MTKDHVIISYFFGVSCDKVSFGIENFDVKNVLDIHCIHWIKSGRKYSWISEEINQNKKFGFTRNNFSIEIFSVYETKIGLKTDPDIAIKLGHF